MTNIGKIIGIDLGTTNSCVAVLENGKPVVITNSEGGRTTPSMVGFRKDERLVGQLAKRQAITNAHNTVFSIKRFIGRSWGDTEQERSRVSYSCVPGKDDTVNVQIGDRDYTPQELSAMILQKLKQDAENYLGETVTEAVITVPAYFSNAQRQATRDAGAIAGLTVKRIINEPTAAALAYDMSTPDQDQRILVFDLGGGTFDVSILQLGDGVAEVMATAGNNHLGGDDFDDCVVRWLIQQFQEQEGVDLSTDGMALQRLRDAAERAKIELSSSIVTSINLPFIAATVDGPKHIEVELTRATFDDLTEHLVQQTMQPVAQALKDAGLKIDQIDRILLVGGSTRIPAVQSALRQHFQGKTLDSSVNPDEAVALGAAIQGGILSRELDQIVADVIPLPLGIETQGGIFTVIIERNTTIPVYETRPFTTIFDGQTSVEVPIFQGESPLAANNIEIGTLMLKDIPPAMRGEPQIDVTFAVDVNGVLTVSAKEGSSGKEQSVSFPEPGRLNDEDMARIRQQWEKDADVDQQRKQLVELKNSAEMLLNDYAKFLRKEGDRIDPTLKEEGDRLAHQLKTSLGQSTISLIDLKSAFDVFQQALFTIGSAMYGGGIHEADLVQTAIEPRWAAEIDDPDIETAVANGQEHGGDRQPPMDFEPVE